MSRKLYLMLLLSALMLTYTVGVSAQGNAPGRPQGEGLVGQTIVSQAREPSSGADRHASPTRASSSRTAARR